VIGDSCDVQVNGSGPPPFPYQEGLSWTVSGSTATMTDLGNVEGTTANGAASMSVDMLFGDGQGRYAGSIGSVGPVGLWNGSTFQSLGGSLNPQLQWADLNGESQNGLLFGTEFNSPTYAFAYDLNTSTYYQLGSTVNTTPLGANSSGYVVGQDGSGTQGFIWNEARGGSYSLLPGLSIAWGISSNSQSVAGQNQSSKAAVYTASGTLVDTYWSGRATFVNNGGTVVGDTATGWSTSGRAMAEINGQQIDLSNAYAPAGVTFNFCQGLNDAGQILVWAGGYLGGNDNGGCTSYVLTPAIPGDANLDGKVDINDLTIVLAHYGQTGMLWSQGEFTGDGKVDINDLTIVLANYGHSIGSSAGPMAPVPEPASVVLLACCGLAALLAGARRRTRVIRSFGC
jgi:hypothetical protein